MSNVSNIHQFFPLNKDSKPLSGQRLVRLICKKAKNGEGNPNLSQSLCVSVPWIAQDEVAESIDKLLPHVMALVRDTQDKIIREHRLEHGRNEIPGEAFGIEQVISYLDAAATGDRVSAEYLQEWFMSEYAEQAASFIRLAIDGAADTVVEHKVAVLRDMFAGWSSNRYSPNIPQLKAMIRFAGYVGEDGMDGRMHTLVAKASEMLKKKEAELASDALGF